MNILLGSIKFFGERNLSAQIYCYYLWTDVETYEEETIAFLTFQLFCDDRIKSESANVL